MQTVILAAGEGIKLTPQAEEIPKALLRVGKQTIIEHALSQLPPAIREVIIVVGHLKHRIKKHLGTNVGGRQIRYVEQMERLGTGHALFTVKEYLNDNKFLVVMGDNLYLRRDMENCLRHELCLLAQRVEAPERFGILKTDSGMLEDIVESPKIFPGTMINCGLYVLDKRIFNYSLAKIGDKEFGLPQTIVKMSREHPVTIEKANFWISINSIQDLKQADKYLKQIYL